MSKYTNRFIYCFEKTVQETIGANGKNALKGLASVYEFWDELPPLNDLREVDADYIGKICQATIDMYGKRGGLELQKRWGQGTFAEIVQHFYPLEITSLQMDAVLRSLLQPLFDPFEEQPRVIVAADRLVCVVPVCPNCEHSRQHSYFVDDHKDEQLCGFIRGYMMSALEYIAPGKQIVVEETACRIGSQPECRFEITWVTQ